MPYDLVIFDECHKLSARQEQDFTIRKTDRYKLAEALAGVKPVGVTVKDVSAPERARAAGLDDWCGFDLLSRRRDATQIVIEVKGRVRTGEVELSEKEWAKACNLGDRYWLYVVYDCGTSYPRLVCVRNPSCGSWRKFMAA